MHFLEIWKHPELFEQYNFDELDNKVNYIENVRAENNLFNNVIKELNNRVDIDYIKDSELIEGNEILALKDINFDDEYEELYETNIFDKKVRPSSIDVFFFGKYSTLLKNGRLIIYKKDLENGKIFKFNCGMPNHLKALKSAFETARKELTASQNGVKIPITAKFIEKKHEELFQDYIQINTRLNKVPGGPHIKPEGYGKFRRTININGAKHEYNVEVEGCKWEPTNSDYVSEEMSKLIEYYNTSSFHPILKAAIFKACFIKIHPFRDGNGRLSRLLLNYMLVREGFPTITIRGTNKEEYFFALDSAIENNDYSNLILLIKTELNQRCNQYMSLMDKLNIKDQSVNIETETLNVN